MSTIAYKNGVLACDTAMGFNDEISHGVVKIGKTRRYLFGYAGRTSQMLPLYRWIVKSEKEWITPEDCFMDREALETGGDDVGTAILVAEDGRIWEVTTEGFCIPIPRKIHAIGSGSEYALGAMAAGASAVDAIGIAGTYNAFTNKDVHTQAFNEVNIDPVSPYTICS